MVRWTTGRALPALRTSSTRKPSIPRKSCIAPAGSAVVPDEVRTSDVMGSLYDVRRDHTSTSEPVATTRSPRSG